MNPPFFILAFPNTNVRLQHCMRALNTPTCICSHEVDFCTHATSQYFQQHQVDEAGCAQVFLKV
jgi:hypothetical protein